MSDDVFEGEVVTEQRGSALATRAESTSTAVWTPSFAVAIDDAVSRVEAKHQFFKRVMRANDHYGVIPGTGTKPTLLKPGAELLLANMGLNAEFEDENPPILDVTGAEHNGEPFLAYRRRCKIYRQIGPTESERMLVGQASGSCNSWEKKYRYRNAERVCPECGKSAIIKGKAEYGGGWVCFKKKDGCGAKFEDNDPRMQGETGKVPNAEVFDLENTILKMADKRALVAATLIATGCSDIFTQDVEDLGGGDKTPPQSAPPAQPVIDAQKIVLFDALTAQLPPDEVDAIVRKAQARYGFAETGKIEDLHEGDESRSAYGSLQKAVREFTGAAQ